MGILTGPATGDQREARDLAKAMMSAAMGSSKAAIPAALAICVASVLMKYGDGEGDVDAFAEFVRKVISDTQAARVDRH